MKTPVLAHTNTEGEREGGREVEEGGREGKEGGEIEGGREERERGRRERVSEGDSE